MYMGGIGTSTENDIVRELQGARILITGLSASAGVDIARAFGRLKSKLIVHTSDLSPEVTEVIALVSQSASEIKLYTNAIGEADAAVRFAQTAAQAYGGLDAVINLSRIAAEDMEGISSEADIERLVAGRLTPLAYLTAVTANRMSLVRSEGHILNVVEMAEPDTRRAAAVATFTRAALSSMTRTEANRWAQQAIRVNAVGPRVVAEAAHLAGPPTPKPAVGEAGARSGGHMTGEPDIAALAIYLTTRAGASFSGQVFDCDG